MILVVGPSLHLLLRMGFVQWPIGACLPIGIDPGSRAAKSRSWVKFHFLDQISSRPCQPDMSLGFILSMSKCSDGHCTKPDPMFTIQ